ncbi:MAG TPA: hypothetical protein VI756_09545 [Blastocatellia bacterium]
MPGPGEHETVQARVLHCTQEAGWTYVSRSGAETRRGFDPAGSTLEERARGDHLARPHSTMTRPISEFRRPSNRGALARRTRQAGNDGEIPTSLGIAEAENDLEE